MRPANERRRYNVTSSLIGGAHTQMIPDEIDKINRLFAPQVLYGSYQFAMVVEPVNLMPPMTARFFRLEATRVSWSPTMQFEFYGLPAQNESHKDIGEFHPIEAETKWPPFRRRQFQTHFLEWKC